MPSKAEVAKAVDEIFAAFDKDGSGTLNAAELKTLLVELFKAMNEPRDFTAEEVNTLLKAIDKGGDGTINKEELISIIERVG